LIRIDSYGFEQIIKIRMDSNKFFKFVYIRTDSCHSHLTKKGYVHDGILIIFDFY